MRLSWKLIFTGKCGCSDAPIVHFEHTKHLNQGLVVSNVAGRELSK